MRAIKGRTIGKGGDFPEIADRKGDVVYPTFYIGIEHLPEAKDWKIGKTYEVTLRIKQTGLNLRRHEGKDKDFGDASFEITGICVHGEDKEEGKTYSRISKSAKKDKK